MALLRDPGSERTLTHFVAQVQNETIRSALRYYTLEGTLGRLLDAEHDGLTDGHFLVFEIEDLMAMGERNLIPVLLYLFRRFERSLHGQPAYLLLDEAWIMLGHPVFRAKIREWLKVMRKANCAVVLATQSLSDAARSGILDVLIEVLPDQDFPAERRGRHGRDRGASGAARSLRGDGPQRNADRDHPERDEEAALLPGVAGRAPVVRSRPGSDRAFLRRHQLEGTDRPSDPPRAREGEKWPFAWLAEQGVDHEALQ